MVAAENDAVGRIIVIHRHGQRTVIVAEIITECVVAMACAQVELFELTIETRCDEDVR